jgi:hypothetical protein
MNEEMAGISRHTQTLLSFHSVFVSKHQICHHNRNFCGSHNLLLLSRSLFFVLHTWACWDGLCTYTWFGPRHFASGSIAHTKVCHHFCICHLPSQIIFLKSSYLMDVMIFSFYFSFPPWAGKRVWFGDHTKSAIHKELWRWIKVLES